MRHVARKMGLYDLEVVSPWGHCFWTGELVYDKYDIRAHGYNMVTLWWISNRT